MWTEEAIEMHAATLTEQEQLVIGAVMQGYALEQIKDYVFLVVGPNYDENYVEHIYHMLNGTLDKTKYN